MSEMIFIFGISLSLFLIILLILKKGKNIADKVLLFWLFVIAIHQSLFYLHYSDIISEYGFLLGTILPFVLLHGPFLYIYTSLLIKPPSFQKTPNYWIHFLPFFLMHIYLIKFYNLPISEKLFIFKNGGIGYDETFVKVKFILNIISGIGYVCWSFILIRTHQKSISQEFSNTDKINLKWLQHLIYGLLFVWIVVIFGNDNHIFFAVTLFVLTIGIFGIRQGHIFAKQISSNSYNNTIISKVKNKQENFNNRYLNSGLTEDGRLLIKKELKKLIDDEKIFLIPELSLSTLTSKLNSQPNYVSQYINEELGVSFYDYINSKRVSEFKFRISDSKYQHYKLIEIAYDCGFNSKSSFNRIFKKITGITPSEFSKKTN